MSGGAAPAGWWREDDDNEDDDNEEEQPEEGQAPEEAPAERGPGREPESRAGSSVSEPCWSCGAAMSPRDARCPSCDRTRTHVLLICGDPCLELRHGPGPPLTLGRHPDWAPRTAAFFADRPKISRRHASITVEPDGTAWVEEPPAGSHNGTFLNSARLAPGIRTPLRDGDQLRLGLRVSIAVRLYGPGTAAGSATTTGPGPGVG
ncbi:FHA domain-containing protein [Streptomyces sparsogenes]|uniref:FHA domain-containing protein n=1 Tax=Streptomyces sparsogenes TaxID=67365 RepID=UPI0033C12A89